MNVVLTLLQKLELKGVRLRLDNNNNIKIRGTTVGIDSEIINDIKQNKSLLVEWLQSQAVKTSGAGKSPVNAVARDQEYYPLSFSQKRLWFLTQMEENGPEYNVASAWRISGAFDVVIAEQAFKLLIERHEPLRTVFVDTAQGPMQIISKAADFKIQLTDLSALTGVKQDQAVDNIANEHAAQPFDLSCDFMLRSTFLKLDQEQGVLLLNMHLIASDGWSLSILSREFFILYQTIVEGKTNPLPPLAIQYADYAHWQQENLQGEVFESQLAYWEHQLAEVPQVHGLMLDKPRPKSKEYVGVNVSGQLSADVATSLQQLAQKYQLTPFMLLHAALALILSRHSDSNDIIIATPVANRKQAELEPLIGFFVNTLVLRVDTGYTQLDEYLAHVRKVHLDGQANQDIPFEQLVERLNIPRSTAHTPLFQIMLTTDTDYGLSKSNDTESFSGAGISLSVLQSKIIKSDFDLELNISISDEGVLTKWIYDKSLFTQEHVEQINEHLSCLLTALAELDDKAVAGKTFITDLPMMSNKELNNLINTLNDTQADYPKEKCIHELFEQQVIVNPDNIALVLEDKKLTYQEVNEKSNQLAHYLIEHHDITPDSLVGICIDRSLEMVIGILGILKAGGAYIPLDPKLPDDRLKYLLGDTQVSIVLTFNKIADQLKFNDVTKLSLDSDEYLNAAAKYPKTNICVSDISLKESNLAYVIYTSGSTGDPKGVMIEHKACLNHCYAMIDSLSLTSQDSIAQTAPLSFDISVWQTLTMLLIGGTSCIICDDIVKSPSMLLDEVEKQGICILQLVPSLLHLVLELGGADLTQLASLRWLLVTGEACSRKLQRRWSELCPNISLMNAYGPAECADDVTLFAVNNSNDHPYLDLFNKMESKVSYYCREFPKLFNKAIYSEMFDHQGQRYIDFLCGAGALNYGHNNPILKAPLIEYMNDDRITHSLDFYTTAKAEFLDIFNKYILKPRNLDFKVMFTGPTGTNAVEAALKLARKATGRKAVLHCGKSFHGMTIGSLSVTGDHVYKTRAGIPLEYTKSIEFITRQGDGNKVEEVLDNISELMEEIPAAIILEVVQAEGGINVADGDWLKKLFAYAKEKGILIIVDDIQAGCGRTGKFFSFEHYGVTPDLICLSKSIAGFGLPMALVLIRPELDVWFSAEHNGTFRGNNHAFVTAAKAIEVYWSNSQFENDIGELARLLTQGLMQIITKYPELNGKHKGIGMIQGIECAPASITNKIKLAAFNNKLILESAGKQDEVIKLMPALTITPELLLEGLSLLDKAVATALLPESSEDFQALTMPIGKPISNMRVYVVDKQHIPVPFGVVGELCVAGTGLARGYINRPSLTCEQFLEIKFNGKPERVYKTGDLVRYLSDGNLEFIGRLDHQVKIRGFRIELGEVEYKISRQPGVDSVLVMAKTNDSDDKQLVAYVKPAANPLIHKMDKDKNVKVDFILSIKEGLESVLPEYMIPSAFELIEEWPLTPNGKINRKALPDPDGTLQQGEYQAPNTGSEKALVAIWSKLMNIEEGKISTSANFFELGGHSLLAIRLVSEIRSHFNIELRLWDIFDTPVLAELVGKMPEDDTTNTVIPAIVSIKRDYGPMPVSFAQQRIWFIDQIEGNSAHYNMPFCLKLRGEFDEDKAEQALSAIIQRHEPLRTVFADYGQGVVQIIRPDVAFVLNRVDLQGLSNELQQQSVKEAINTDALKPFDLQRDVMMRGSFIRLASDEGVLLLNVHHIASDGWSINIMEDEFVRNYQALNRDEKLNITTPTIQYADFTQWQRQWLQGDVLEQKLDYWQDKLANIPVVNRLPLDRPRKGSQFIKGGLYSTTLENDLTTRLNAHCRSQEVSLFMAVQASFAVLLARYSGEQDIVMGAPVAGRDDTSLEQLVGLFLNTMVFRTQLDDNPTFDQLLARSKKDHLDSHQHSAVPFELIVEKLAPQRSLLHSPIFQIMINMDNTERSSAELSTTDIAPLLVDQDFTNKYEITLYVNETKENKLNFNWVYDASLFEPSTIAAMARGLNSLICEFIAHPKKPVLSVSWQQDAHWKQPNAVTQKKFIHQLFEKQVDARPNALALVSGEQSLTYAELEAAANRLAHYLRNEHQVIAGDKIGVTTQRNEQRVIAVLAIYKLGAVWVPLSQELPLQRLAYIVDNADCKVLLSDKNNPVEASVVLDEVNTANRILAQSAQRLDGVIIEGDSSAHIIYTSGSTGHPKGVVGTQQATVNRIQWMLEEFPFGENEKACHITSMAFIRGIWELLVPLCAGVPLSLIDRSMVKDLPKLVETVQAQQITRIVTSPSLMSAITPLLARTEGGWEHLEYWFVSGESLPVQLTTAIAEVLPQVVMYNLYGSTEVMSDVLYCQVNSNNEQSLVAAGKPIANIAVTIVDSQLNPVPDGIMGELVVTGPALALGYQSLPEQTGEQFIDTPVGRGYRTGDLGRVLANGDIECIGRRDHQLKIRGYRVELGEIEGCLMAIDQIMRTVVIADKDSNGDPSLVAYVQLHQDQPMGENELTNILRRQLSAQLPDYMVPSIYVLINDWPITANGKLNRKALPAPDRNAAQCHYVAPTTRTEQKMVQIWADLLQLDTGRISTAANFFSMGGHSLLTVRLIGEIQEQFDVKLAVRSIFDSPNLADIALQIEDELTLVAVEKTKANTVINSEGIL